MTRMARSRGRLGPVALLAVLAITAGWSPPPARPGSTVAGLGARGAVDASRNVVGAATAAAARQRLDTATQERAAAWATDWDALATAAAGADDGTTATPAERHDRGVRLAGAGTTPPPNLAPSGTTKTFRGRNHFWIPALGMSTSVVPFPCPRKRPPDNYMYRWGCAKNNNVYILGHAYSVMKPLYNAYMRGQLHVGMVAVYADGNGRIRTYRVVEWRVVDPAEGVHWAIAAQPVPSMTLQTCVGKYSQWRLNVRLVATD